MVVFRLQHNGPKLHQLGNKAAGGTAAQGPSLNLKQHGNCWASHCPRKDCRTSVTLHSKQHKDIQGISCISHSWRITDGPITHIPHLEHPFFMFSLPLSASSTSFSWPHLLSLTLASKASFGFKTGPSTCQVCREPQQREFENYK